MKAMTLRSLDPKVADTLRRRAQAEGRSLNALIVDILTRAARETDRRERIREHTPRRQALRAEIGRRFGRGTPSEKLVREDRKR
jgi:plasmid stability protein